MLRRLQFENFASFLEKACIDFTVNDNAPHSSVYGMSVDETRVNKVAAFIGPNASGKTNVLKAMAFLQYFISVSFRRDPESDSGVIPFALKEDWKHSPSSLSVEFEVDSEVFEYSVSLTLDRVFSEGLVRIWPKNRKTVFHREWNQAKSEYIFERNDELFAGTADFSSSIRPNASTISTGAQFNHPLCSRIRNYWNLIQTNVDVDGKQIINSSAEIARVNKFYHDNQHVFNEVKKQLRRLDLGIRNVMLLDLAKTIEQEVSTPEAKNTEAKTPQIVAILEHAAPGKAKGQFLPFDWESGGTKSLYILLRTLVTALLNGSTAVLDELDCDLHPHLVPPLMDLFYSPQTNPKGAQLFFSCHSTQTIQELDKYQVYLTEKSPNGVSEVFRLSEVKGVRSDGNLFSKYNAGAFGAIPKI